MWLFQEVPQQWQWQQALARQLVFSWFAVVLLEEKNQRGRF